MCVCVWADTSPAGTIYHVYHTQTHTHTFVLSFFIYTHADKPFSEIKASNKTSLFSLAATYSHTHTLSCMHVSPAHKQPLIVAHTADIWKKGHTFLSLSLSVSLPVIPPTLSENQQTGHDSW